MTPVLAEVSLRIRGDDLNPDEITRLLGRIPDRATRNGETFIGRSGKPILSKTGVWQVGMMKSNTDFDTQSFAILKTLPDDRQTWRTIASRFECELFCGLWFHGKYLKTMGISPSLLEALAIRSIGLDLHFYDLDLLDDEQQPIDSDQRFH